jgi:hypothetical protein
MADNGERCSNCGTENPEGADFCIKCEQPLTASADESIRENLDAQDNDSLFGAGGAGDGRTGLGLDAMGGGMMMPGDSPGGATMPHEGLPPRRS